VKIAKVGLKQFPRKDARICQIYFRFLKSAVEKGVHHRDMKLGNVLFKKDIQKLYEKIVCKNSTSKIRKIYGR